MKKKTGRKVRPVKALEPNGKKFRGFHIDQELYEKFNTTTLFFGDGNMTNIVEGFMEAYVEEHKEEMIERLKTFWDIDAPEIKF